MAIDHSLTYRTWSLTNIPHVLRLRHILKICDSLVTAQYTYADFGCSNGYITNIVQQRYSFGEAVGFDHSEENIRLASDRYKNIAFYSFDLAAAKPLRQFDFVSCFETLEHVGDVGTAVRKLLDATAPAGTLLISVPIEIGAMGMAKYLAKVLLGYSLAEISGNPSIKTKYFVGLLRGGIASFREPGRRGWSTHFGFDYRIVDEALQKNGASYAAHNYMTTRFYVVTHGQTKAWTE